MVQSVKDVKVVRSRGRRSEIRSQKSEVKSFQPFTAHRLPLTAYCLPLTKIKSSIPSGLGEVELSQRTDQFSIVSEMGRGTPVPAKLLPCSRAVNHSQSYGAKGR